MNKKFISRCVAAALALTTLTSSFMAFADTQYVGIGSADTNVYLNIDNSDLLVGVPSTVILSGTPDENGKYIGDYSVSVKGDMSGTDTLYVQPDREVVDLVQKGKNNESATITQEQVAFNSDELSNGKTVTGSIAADKLSAGSWNGSFAFDISLDRMAKYGRKIKSWDVSATEDDNVLMTYYSPENIIETGTSSQNAAPVLASISPQSDKDYVYTDVEQYEDGTVVISGQGNMEELLYQEWFDLENYRKDLVKTLEEARAASHPSAVPRKYVILVDDYIGSSNYDILKSYFKKTFGDIIEYSRDYYTEYLIFHSNNPFKIEGAYHSYKMENGTDYLNAGASYAGTTSPAFGSFVKEHGKEYIQFLPSKVVIEDGVTNISKGAFFSFFENTLSDIQIGNSVKEIGLAAFGNCKNLESITIPDSCEKIDGDCFFGCSNLKNVNLGNGLKEVGYGSFGKCTSLEEISFPDNMESISGSVNTDLITGFVENGVTNQTNGTFNGCTNLKKVHLGKNLKSIGSYCFYNCPALTDVNLPEGLTVIGKNVFGKCNSLTELTFPSSLEHIHSRAFSNSGITTINIPVDSNLATLDAQSLNLSATAPVINCPQNIADIILADTDASPLGAGKSKTTVNIIE